jgi:hypothetical protein
MSETKGYLNLVMSLKARFIFARKEDQLIREGFDHHLFTSSYCSQTFAGVQALADSQLKHRSCVSLLPKATSSQ